MDEVTLQRNIREMSMDELYVWTSNTNEILESAPSLVSVMSGQQRLALYLNIELSKRQKVIFDRLKRVVRN